MGFWSTLGKFLFLRWLWRGLSGEESTRHGVTDNPTNRLAHPYDRMSPIYEDDLMDRDDYNYEYDMDYDRVEYDDYDYENDWDDGLMDDIFDDW